MVANGLGDCKLSSLTGRSPITNLEDSVVDTVGTRDVSELDSTVGGREIESSLELTIPDGGAITSRCSTSIS